MPDGRRPEEDPTLLLLLLGGGAVALGLFALGRQRRPVGPGGAISPCPPLGDVDDDGFVTTNDARLVLEAHAGLRTLTPDQLLRADVNRDGRVDSIDALLIEQVAARLPGAEDGFRCELPPAQPAV